MIDLFVYFINCPFFKLIIIFFFLYMDSQYDGFLIDLLMNDTDLYDDTIQKNPTVLTPVQNEVVPRARKSQRTNNFSIEEDKLIVSVWLNTSKDAITRNEQGGAFWQKILQYLELHGDNHEERSQSSIKSCWTNINAKCSKFVVFIIKLKDCDKVDTPSKIM